MAYNTEPLARLQSDDRALNAIRDQLRDSAMSTLNSAVADIALELVRDHGLDLWTAKLLVASLALDGVRALQTVAAADARDMGVPVRAAAAAMGYSSATPLQRDGENVRTVQTARDEATESGKPVTVRLHGWAYELPPGEAFR